MNYRLLVAPILLSLLLHTAFAQTESIEEAFQKALKNVEQEKAKEQEELISDLKNRLNLALQDWLSTAAKEKSPQINSFIKQNWEKLNELKNSTYYDYYLKDFAYVIVKSDIIRTDSLISPYKASISVNEELYVERYHPAGVSFREKFFYTATRPIILSFEYSTDKFAIINTEYKDYTLAQGWPEEIKIKVLSR
jgi:hypothetical protein